MDAEVYIKNIILNGSPEEKRLLFQFDSTTPEEKVLFKFKLFARSQYPRYFESDDAPFHDGMIVRAIRSYRGENVGDIGFRGSAKTSLNKLVRTFLVLNDTEHYRKYLKVLCRDIMNSKQIVTDIYNLCLEVSHIYGDMFEKEGDKKREETMGSFILKSGVKVTAGTVGQKQRGHIQDAYRPDWIWFEDIEDVESVSSQIVTEGVIKKCDEAIKGLSRRGSWQLTGNYISDTGSVQWFLDKKNIVTAVTPIASTFRVDGGKVVECVPTWPIYSVSDIQVLYDDSLDFYGDYMCDPTRTENKFFNIEKIEANMKIARLPTRRSGDVKFWGSYQPHHRYGQGSDHSEGVGQDANTLAGFNFNTGELIYTYANNEIAPDLAAHEFANVGSQFGNCVWGPETNNRCGGIVIATALSIPYPTLYKPKLLQHEQEHDSTTKVGWETNSKTKTTMFFEFRRDYNDGLIIIYDIELLKEMKAYTNADLKERTTGLITRHFDLLTAAVIAWQMRNEIPEKRQATVTHHDI